MSKSLARLMMLAVIAFTVRPEAFGQAATDTSKGSINVVVKDSSGGIVPGAKVTAQGPMGDTSATSNDHGEANFFSLVPGTYRVRVVKEGFSTAQIDDIPVQATQRSNLPVTLQTGQVNQTVEVSETSVLVDTSSTTIETDLNAAQYQQLPVGRNVTSLFYLAPGVADGGGTGTANPSISGASGLENQYIIDGINDTDSGYGGFGVYSDNYGSLGTGVNFDFVKEIQIKTGGFEAQYGQAMGGIINIITNSGGNAIHGSAYGFSSPAWTEPNYHQVDDVRTGSPETQTVSQRQFDYGFNAGGPFIKNKFFWYGAFNPSYRYFAREAPTGFAVRAQGPIPLERRALNWVGKLNFNITDSQRLEGTAFADPSISPSTVQGSLLRDNLDSASSLNFGTRNWAVKYSGSFGASTLLSASFAWNKSYFTEKPQSNTFALTNYAAPTSSSLFTLQGGSGYLGNSDGNNKQYNTMATRNVNLLGSHQFDLGYSYNDVSYDAVHIYTGPRYALPAADGIDPGDVGKLVNGGAFTEYTNRTVAGVVYPTVFRVTRGNFSNPSVSTVTNYNDAFLQDAWRLNRFVTVKAGVRWEQQKLLGNTNHYTLAANWAPRIGFILDPLGHGKTKLFGNFGRFFEKIPQDLAVRALSSESGYNSGYFLALPTASSVQPVPGTTFSPVGVSPTIVYGGTKAAYEDELSGGIEQDLGHGLTLRASFTNRSLKRGLEDTSGITVEQALAGSGQQYVIQNPNVHSDTFHNAVTCDPAAADCTSSGYTADSGSLGPDGNADGFPDMRRVYNALEISVDKRFSKQWSLISNYRLAKLFGNYEGSFRNDNGQSDPNITSLFDFVNSPALADQFKVGPLNTDRRHIINLYANYTWGTHWVFGMGNSTQSGAPISKLGAHPAYQNPGEIPIGGRGTLGRTPWQNYFDTRVSYDLPIKDKYHVRVAADLFNIASRQTETDTDQDYELAPGVLNPDFLKPLTYHRPFHAQFSLRFEF